MVILLIDVLKSLVILLIFGKKKYGQNLKRKNISNNNSVGTSSSSGFTDEQMATVLSLIKDSKIGKNVQANLADTLLGLPAEPVLNTREHFPLSDHTSKFLGDLVHLDLWGPYKMPNDDERVDPNLNSDNKSQSDSSHSSMSGRDVNTADFPDNSGNDAESREDIFSTQTKKSSGEIDRYKARLVPQGFGQKEGIDYEETFSPVVKMVTVRCLLNVVVSNSWPVFQLDMNNVFLYGDLDETVYMKPPEGYFPLGNKVCKLKKSLYGLKQAPRQWNAKLTSALIENGFNDIIITGNNVFEIENFKVYLKSKFMIKELGKLKYFLDIEVIDTDRGICLNQKTFDNDQILDNITNYQKLMGKLIYLTNTRPDISYVVFGHSYHQGICKKQNILSKSLTEAEYRALASVTNEVI
ncbi:ribonuclease H-like domain-containing protein [Tanacetum coccineum]